MPLCEATTPFVSLSELKSAVLEYPSDRVVEVYGDISEWDVSRVTDMKSLFRNMHSFNADISKWNVSNVRDMSAMFDTACSFNADISGWVVSSVTNMNSMFYRTDKFSCDISNWDVSNVTDMEWMFRSAHAFNSDISTWDVRSVIKMSLIFHDAPMFKCNISDWDFNAEVNLRGLFDELIPIKQVLDMTVFQAISEQSCEICKEPVPLTERINCKCKTWLCRTCIIRASYCPWCRIPYGDDEPRDLCNAIEN